jgi:excisionase family DNA binding protein
MWVKRFPVIMPSFMTLGEVAATLRCHPRTVRRLIRRGKLPYTRVGLRYLFDREALARVLAPAAV